MDCIENRDSHNHIYVKFTNCISVGEDLPNVQLSIDNYVYTLPPSFYAYEAYNNTCDLLWDYDDTDNNNLGSKWILGTPFMNLFYSVYDMKRNQVGLVPSIYVNN